MSPEFEQFLMALIIGLMKGITIASGIVLIMGLVAIAVLWVRYHDIL